MSYVAYVATLVWVLALALLGVAAAERKDWRVFGMVFALMVATGLVILAANVMAPA